MSWEIPVSSDSKLLARSYKSEGCTCKSRGRHNQALSLRLLLRLLPVSNITSYLLYASKMLANLADAANPLLDTYFRYRYSSGDGAKPSLSALSVWKGTRDFAQPTVDYGLETRHPGTIVVAAVSTRRHGVSHAYDDKREESSESSSSFSSTASSQDHSHSRSHSHSHSHSSHSSQPSSPSTPTSPLKDNKNNKEHTRSRRASYEDGEDDWDPSAQRPNVIPGFPEQYGPNSRKKNNDETHRLPTLSLKTVANVFRWTNSAQQGEHHPTNKTHNKTSSTS